MDSFSSEVGNIHYCKKGFPSKISNIMADNADPDETAHNEPSHLDLHCLQKVKVLICRVERVKSEN